jgi:hypothetical protein
MSDQINCAKCCGLPMILNKNTFKCKKCSAFIKISSSSDYFECDMCSFYVPKKQLYIFTGKEPDEISYWCDDCAKKEWSQDSSDSEFN